MSHHGPVVIAMPSWHMLAQRAKLSARSQQLPALPCPRTQKTGSTSKALQKGMSTLTVKSQSAPGQKCVQASHEYTIQGEGNASLEAGALRRGEEVVKEKVASTATTKCTMVKGAEVKIQKKESLFENTKVKEKTTVWHDKDPDDVLGKKAESAMEASEVAFPPGTLGVVTAAAKGDQKGAQAAIVGAATSTGAKCLAAAALTKTTTTVTTGFLGFWATTTTTVVCPPAALLVPIGFIVGYAAKKIWKDL